MTGDSLSLRIDDWSDAVNPAVVKNLRQGLRTRSFWFSFTAVLLQLNVHYKTRVAVKFTGIPELETRPSPAVAGLAVAGAAGAAEGGAGSAGADGTSAD